MTRKICRSTDTINLLFAQETDRRLIYDLSIEDNDVILSMFNQPSDFHWAELRDEKPIYFNGEAGHSKYLLIEQGGQIVGVFCHVFHDAPIQNMELHIWMRGMKHTGKGIGSQVLTAMMDYLSQNYAITTFLMRPWTKNPRAVHVYQKCGFHIEADFDLTSYFTEAEIALHGNGAYTVEETVNMLRTV